MTKVTCMKCDIEMKLESSKKDWMRGKLTEVIISIYRCIRCNYSIMITIEVKNDEL